MEKLFIEPQPRIETFNPKADLQQVTMLYAQVFAGPPWNEYTKCTGCFEFFGLQTKPEDLCGNCGNQLVLAYPEKETKEYILKEKNRPNSICILAKDGDEIIGFAWGYTYASPVNFVEQKYRTQEMKDKIVQLFQADGISCDFFYFSECGVKEDKRGRNISNLLAEALFRRSKILNLPVILRTNWQSPMMAVAERFGMRQIMGPCVEIDRLDRSIRTTGNVVNDFSDSEIEERVLFVLQ